MTPQRQSEILNIIRDNRNNWPATVIDILDEVMPWALEMDRLLERMNGATIKQPNQTDGDGIGGAGQ